MDIPCSNCSATASISIAPRGLAAANVLCSDCFRGIENKRRAVFHRALFSGSVSAGGILAAYIAYIHPEILDVHPLYILAATFWVAGCLEPLDFLAEWTRGDFTGGNILSLFCTLTSLPIYIGVLGIIAMLNGPFSLFKGIWLYIRYTYVLRQSAIISNTYSGSR